MSIATIYIIAASDSDPGKVIIGVVFFVIWVISSVLSAASKKREQERRERIRASLEGITPPAPPALPSASQPKPQRQPAAQVVLRRIDTEVRPKAQQRRPAQKKTKRRVIPPAGVQKSPPPIPSAARSVSVIESSPISLPVPSASVSRQTIGATASTLRNWMRPATMRQQFILTEILQPPLSLREK